MANPIIFKKGLRLNLDKITITDGTIYLTEDTNELFYDNIIRSKIINTDTIFYLIETSIDMETEVN